MAINRIWQSGFEEQTTDVFNNIDGISISSGQSKTGAYSMLVPSGGGVNYGVVNIPATRQISCGFYLYGNTGLGNNKGMFLARGGASNLSGIELSGAGLDYALTLDIAGADVDSEPNINETAWFHLGIDMKIDNSSGWVYVYRDGKLIIGYDGNTGNTDIDLARIGYSFGAGDSGNAVYFDDAYIDDTTGEISPTGPRIKRFYPIEPNGDGNYSQWTPSTGTTHYELVDERPPDGDVTYVEAITGSLYDSFDMTTFALDTNEDIIAMIPFAFAKRGSSTELIALGTRSSGTDSVGSDQGLSTDYDYVWERQITGSLGADWNQSYLDSVEVLIKSAGTYE